MTRDTVPVMALGAVTVLGWLWLLIDNREMRARLNRHRTELNGHARHLTWLTGSIDTPATKTAPMPPARVSPEWQERRAPKVDRPRGFDVAGLVVDQVRLPPSDEIDRWADVLPPDHVLPVVDRHVEWLASAKLANRVDSGDTLTMPAGVRFHSVGPVAQMLLDNGAMRLATTTARLRPPTIAPPADVLDALHRSGHPMTRRDLAEVLERSDWELTTELRDLIHAGRITVASTAHNTEAAYIPTGAHHGV